jgi:quercetin 2,3-dioxygenase
MIEVRPFGGLGAFRNEWLDSHFHFSFAEYYDPRRMGFGGLRVWNDDQIAPGTGFDPHPHRDMEIITYVRQGAITHRDNLGNEGRTEAGDVQVMHAGTGIVHAEYNRDDEPTSLFQIWIQPNRRGVTPGWSTRQFPKNGAGLSVLASGRAGDADAGALPLYADAAILAGTIKAGETARRTFAPGSRGYLVASTGALDVNGVRVGPRDGAAIADETVLDITATEDAEVVLVEVAG